MTLNVKAGTPEGVHDAIPNRPPRHVVREYSDSPVPRNSRMTIAQAREQMKERTDAFTKQMGEGFSSEETNQGNPFDSPAAKRTNLTLSESMAELNLRLRLFMVAVFIPEDYEVVQVKPQRLLREFLGEARSLWESYEPLLGVHNPVTVLQVEAPPEEDEDG